MITPSEDQLFEAIDATWPAFRRYALDGWIFREGRGGGKRVSATSLVETSASIDLAIEEMGFLGQAFLFMIRGSDVELDANLATRGFVIVDPVVLLGQETAKNGEQDASFLPNTIPSKEQLEIWSEGGIGPARIKVMARAKGPSCFAALKEENETCATAFAAIHNDIAMVHAVEVSKEYRRRGLGRKIMQGLSHWAGKMGAKNMVVLTVRDNVAAQSLYESMGMIEVGAYHYRKDINDN